MRKTIKVTRKGPFPNLEDCAGIYSKYDTLEEAKKEMDELRRECEFKNLKMSQ